MNYTPEESGAFQQKSNYATEHLNVIAGTIREPLIFLNKDHEVLSFNSKFSEMTGLKEKDLLNRGIFTIGNEDWDASDLRNLLQVVFPGKVSLSDFPVHGGIGKITEQNFLVNACRVPLNIEDESAILLTFKEISGSPNALQKIPFHLKNLENILTHAPAMICILRGPEFVFEVANERYYQLVGNRDLIGKPARQAIPEAEGQGFFELLEEVYQTGKAYIGNEVPINLDDGEKKLKNSYLDFVYQPTFDAEEKVDGVFVYVADVTEKVLIRKKLEEKEKYLESHIESVPAMIWITDPDGKSTYLNTNWYAYTGQNLTTAENFGWLDALHPEDAKPAGEEFIRANKKKEPYSYTYRLRHKNGDYRWVIDKGRPKFDAEGNYEGMVGTVVDVHEEKIQEQLIAEKEHRLRSIVEEAPVATAVYTGIEMKIELANDAMIQLWGKDRSVRGKILLEALPELEGQPFKELLEEVFRTGKTYWGKEQIVDLQIGQEMQRGYFNFSYTPLRNEDGKIYGILNMAQNVSEMVASKALLEESENHFRQMADLMPTKVTNTDAEGNFLYFNQGWLDFTGLTLSELKLSGWMQFIHPEQKEEFLKIWERSLETGEKFEMEIKFRKRNGIYTWHIHRAEAVKDEKGRIKMWIGATIDIQEQKEVMESLEYSKALLETHTQANLDGILLVDTKGKIISYNQRFVDIWGMPDSILETRNDEAALKFAEKQLISADNFLLNIQKLYDSPNQVCKDELRFKDGKIVERHGYPVVGVDGTFYAWSWTFRDITLQKNQEKNIKESELYFRQMTDLMPGKIINTDEKGNLTYFNQHWLEYTGQDKEELKEKGWIRFIHPKQQKKFVKNWNRSLESGENFEMEIKLLNINGKYKWHISRAEAVRDESGKIKLWICTNTEIQKLKEEEKRKGDFLKMVSHELKTPVTSIKGYVQLLLSLLNDGQEKDLSSLPIKPSLERIDHQIRRLTRLIAEMLDLSRIEENKLELQKETFNLNDLVTETVQDINYTNTQHQIEVYHKFRCTVHGDKDRIGQVLINYVTNAIKYSPDNQKIDITVEKGENGQVAVSVKDWGIGIEKKYHKSIFKRFYRVGVKSEETYSGFGIGLYLAKEIISRHKGATIVKSKKGKGSEFIFTLQIESED